MKDLGAASRILGMDIIREKRKGTLKVLQAKYLQKVLETLNMTGSKVVVNPIGPQFKLKSLTQEEDMEARLSLGREETEDVHAFLSDGPS